MPITSPAQVAHAPPLAPHAFVALPAWHELPSQHPPLHTSPPAQLRLHACVCGLHALPGAQSEDVLQPQVPLARHATPMTLVVQLTHAAPVTPHCPALDPATQVEPPQQPPLHVLPPVQAAPHVCVVVSHAVSGGQSANVLHPHAAPIHAWPGVAVVQSVQAPGVPQLAPVPRQGVAASASAAASEGASVPVSEDASVATSGDASGIASDVEPSGLGTIVVSPAASTLEESPAPPSTADVASLCAASAPVAESSPPHPAVANDNANASHTPSVPTRIAEFFTLRWYRWLAARSTGSSHARRSFRAVVPRMLSMPIASRASIESSRRSISSATSASR